MLKFHNNLKYPIIIPIIFGLIALYSFIDSTLILRRSGFFTPFFIISCIVAAITTLKGTKKKIYVIVAMSLGLLCEAITIEIYLHYMISCEVLGAICLYVALLLFALKYKLPPIILSAPESNSDDIALTEQSLKLLKEKLELGIITEEEYQTQRTEIISKL